METRWLYRTSGDLEELVQESKGVCVIPMGCVEKHGLHLPLGTDIMHAGRIAYLASQLETVCIFPDFIFGDVPGRTDVTPHGNVSVSLELEMMLLEQLCGEISRNGFKKIAVYNGHGGNRPWLQSFMRKVRRDPHDYALVVIDCGLSVPHVMAEKILAEGRECVPEMTDEDVELVLKYHEQGMTIGHACFCETAYIMENWPETVKLDRLGVESGLSVHAADYLNEAGITMENAGWDVDYPNAYSGHDPVGCNERIGRAAVRLEAERVAHAFKVLKEEDKLLGWSTAYTGKNHGLKL